MPSSPAAIVEDAERNSTICTPTEPRPHEEISDPSAAQIEKMSNYGPWHNTYLAIYFTLTGLHALHVIGGAHRHRLPLGAGQQAVGDRPGALHQPHRDLRPVLALRGPGLDFPVPCAYTCL